VPPRVPPDEVTWGELRTALDAELAKLPDKWRLPLILCYTAVPRDFPHNSG
jgi:hypothetical protein